MYAKFYVAEARMNSYGVRLLCNMKLFQQAKEKEVSFLLGLPRIILLFGFWADSLLQTHSSFKVDCFWLNCLFIDISF